MEPSRRLRRRRALGRHALGAVEYVTKPIDWRRLATALDKYRTPASDTPTLVPGMPRLWSETSFTTVGMVPNFDIAPDGKRFAVLMSAEKPGDKKPRNELTVLLNFFTEVRRRAAAGEGR